MPLDTCISNVGEYYSSHYLDSTFTKDVKELVAKWKDQGSLAPPRRLQRLAALFFRVKGQALEEGSDVKAWLFQDHRQNLLDTLVGGETLAARLALPPAADGGPPLVGSRIDHLAVEKRAERTLHPETSAGTG